MDKPYKVYWQRKWLHCWWTIDNRFMFKIQLAWKDPIVGKWHFAFHHLELWLGWFSICNETIHPTDFKYKPKDRIKQWWYQHQFRKYVVGDLLKEYNEKGYCIKVFPISVKERQRGVAPKVMIFAKDMDGTQSIKINAAIEECGFKKV